MGKDIISGYQINNLSMGNLISLYRDLRLRRNTPLEPHELGIPMHLIYAMGFSGWEDLQVLGEEAANKEKHLQARPRPTYSSTTGQDTSQGQKNRTEDYELLPDRKSVSGWEEQTIPCQGEKKPTTLQGIAPTDIDADAKKPTTLRGMAPTDPRSDMPPALKDLYRSMQPSVPEIEHLVGKEQAAPDAIIDEFDAITPSQIVEVSDIPGSGLLSAPAGVASAPAPLIDEGFKVVLSPLMPEIVPRQDPNDKFLDLFAAKHEPARPSVDEPRSEFLEIMVSSQPTVTLPAESVVEQAEKESRYADSGTAIVKPLAQKKKGILGRLSDWRSRRREKSLDDVVQQLYAQKAAIENPLPPPAKKSYSVRKKFALAASFAVAAAAFGAISAAYHSFITTPKAPHSEVMSTRMANISAAQAVKSGVFPSSNIPKPPIVSPVVLDYAANPCNAIEMRLNMHFDSTRFIDKDAKSKIEGFLLEAVKKGHKDIYIYGFASIDGPNDRGNPKNNDDPYNMNLARQRMLAGKDVLQQAAFKHELDVNFITLMNYGETEVYGKDFSPNRTLLMTTRPVRHDPDKHPSVGRELAKNPAGRINTGLCQIMADSDRPVTPSLDDSIKGNTPHEHGSLGKGKQPGSSAYLSQSIAPGTNTDAGSAGYQIVEDSQIIEESPIAESVVIDKAYEADLKKAGERIVRHDAKVMIASTYEKELHENGLSIERTSAQYNDRPVSASGTIENIAKPENDKIIIDPAYEKELARAGYAVEKEDPKVIIEYQQPRLSVVQKYGPMLSCSADTRAALDELSGIIDTIQTVSDAQAKAAKIAGGNSDLADALAGIYADSGDSRFGASSMLYNAHPQNSPAATQQSLLDMLDDKYGSTGQKDHLLQDILYPLKKAA